MMRKGNDLKQGSRHYSKSRSSLRTLLKISELDIVANPQQA